MEETVASGALVIKKPWPGLMRGVYGDPKRFQETYFEQFPGYYTAGDGARRDKDGYYQITGRIDDVINVSGHRMGTAEVESALVAHPKVAEAAVVGYPHELKGQSIYAYVTLKTGVEKSDALKKELVAHVRTLIDPGEAPVGRRPSQDPQRQDHAEDSEEGRRRRHHRPGGHHDAGRSFRGRRHRQEQGVVRLY
jgi:acetyl-CoA synthetase